MARLEGFSAVLLISGCAVVQSVVHPCALILKPQITQECLTKATVSPYDKTSIQHLTLKLYTGGLDTGLHKTLLNAQLDNPVVFSNLKAQTTYQVRAYAYASTDDTALISFNDANSWTDITITNDDRPTISVLKVKLIDRDFSGQATSSLLINPGGYSPIGSESLKSWGPEGIVSTLAGNGSAGAVNGVGSGATFNQPLGLTIDNQNNLYLADSSNHLIRKISPTGVVSTIAGNGTGGFSEGNGTQAMFNCPWGVVADTLGNLYVGDYLNSRIRKITSGGQVSTFAGNGTLGLVDGVGTSASFRNPEGLAIDAAGNIYVADRGNHAVRKITPGGLVTTLAGNGTLGATNGLGSAATFNEPRCLAVDAQGTVFVADRTNHLIRKVTAAGMVSTLVGAGVPGYQNGTGISALINTPAALVIDSRGYLYLVDRGNHRIRVISPIGVVSNLAGNGATGRADGTGVSATFNSPYGLAMDSQGYLFVADSGSQAIRKIQ